MKLVIDLPDWVSKDAILTFLADQELFAFKNPREDLKIKTVRCDQCGMCCMDMPDGHTPFGIDDEGKCNKLLKEQDKWICTAKGNKPYNCLRDPIGRKELGCSIRYK